MKRQRLFIGVFVLGALLIVTAGVALAQGPNSQGGSQNPPGGGKPITSVKAGTGLTGGGTSGDVTLAISTTFQLPQKCANGQVAKWNGTAWACANDGLTLPFAATTDSTGDQNNIFWIQSIGLGSPGLFQIKNPVNSDWALGAVTNGSGSAFLARNSGTGPAARMSVSNTVNSSPVLWVTTNGTGRAGRFQIDNSANSSNALEVTTNGTGQAGNFRIENTANDSAALYVSTNGTGNAGQFKITNPANSRSGFEVQYQGAGMATYIHTDNPASTHSALHTHTVGSGPAIYALAMGNGSAANFIITNTTNTRDVLRVDTYGTGWLGNFTTNTGKGVYISVPSGNQGLNVASGTKNAVVATSNGARLMYTEESSQVWFTDYGFGCLQNGRAVIAIDSLFAQTINLDEPYHVFVQSYGDSEIYVTNRTRTGFEVRARDGDPSVEFSYRLVAKRKGFEDKRLEPAPWADDDPNLYPGK